MTTQTASAETGSNGATVATGDTGTPAWDAVSIGTAAALTYSNTGGCKRGSLCYSFSAAGTSSTAYGEWSVNAGASAAVQYYRTYIDPADFTGLPVLARGMDSAGSTQRWRLVWTGTAVQLRDSSNSTVFTSSTLSGGTRYRVEWRIGGSTTGAVQLIVYVGESATTFYDSGASTGNFGGVIQRIRMGIGAGQTSVAGKCDDFGWSDTAALGPVGTFPPEAAFTVAADAPTAAVGSAPPEAAFTIAADAPVPALGSAPSQAALTIAADAPATALTSAPSQAAFTIAADAPIAVAGQVPAEGAFTFVASAPVPALGPAPAAAALTFAAPQPAVSVANAAGQPFLTALLGPTARIVNEAAFDADLTDVTGSGWIWTDLGTDPRHVPGIPITVGRSDNVGQAGAAGYTSTLNNQVGAYTPGGPNASHNVTQNTPWRQRISLDGSTWFIRFQGYLDAANPVTDQSAKVKGVAITALGRLARLGGLKKPLQSALYRANLADPNLVAYWPMEDLAGSTALGSAVSHGRPMRVISGGPIQFADAGPAGSLPLPNWSNNTVVVGDVSGAAAGSWVVSFALRPNDTSTTDGIQSVSVYSGNLTFKFLYLNPLPPTFPTSAITLTISGSGFNGGVTEGFSFSGADPLMNAGEWAHVQIAAAQVGADFFFNVYCNGVDMAGGIPFGVAATQLGSLTSVRVAGPLGGDFQSNDVNAGHLAVSVPCAVGAHNNPIPANTATLASALTGYTGETADARLSRLCAEQGIALDLSGTSNVTMGPQGLDTILNLLRECEAADHGVLYDGLGPGLGYQCRSSRYNAASVMTLDMGADPPQMTNFGPVFDKQTVKNLYVANRKNGGSATAEQTDGPLGSNLIGVEDAAVTVNTDTDAVLRGHAGWLVSLGTVPGFRFPSIGLNMRGMPSKAAGVLGLGIGDRITIVNPASKATDLPPDDIDLIVEGWAETTSASTWEIALNCSTYKPNIIATVNDSAARFDSADSVVHLDATTTAATISVSGTRLWTTTATNPGDFPFDIGVTGERMTVTAITGSSSPQTFTVTRSVNGVVKTHLAANNEPVRVWTPLVIGL